MGPTTIEVQVLPWPEQEHSHREKPIEKFRLAGLVWRTVIPQIYTEIPSRQSETLRRGHTEGLPSMVAIMMWGTRAR